MPVPLSRRPAPAPAPDAVDMLLACHGRIRQFTGLAIRLGTSRDAPDLAAAAAAVHRYFTVGLPLHSSDEDDLVVPVLTAVCRDAAVSQALTIMTAQHLDLHAQIDRLLPHWELVAREPTQAAALERALTTGAERLAAMFQTHLGMEEELIFPALRQKLPQAELHALAEKLRARRSSP